MPRTSTVEPRGCPPLRALTTDALGLIKVVEAREKSAAAPTVVERWGSPDASRCVLAASYADRETEPILAVARKNASVELINPLNGDCLATFSASESVDASSPIEDDSVVGLHLLKTKEADLSSKSNRLLLCTTKGKASLRTIFMDDASPNSSDTGSSSSWDVCAAGKVICSSVDGDENHALFGGKGIELNLWNLENCSKIWTSKSPRSDKLGIFTPTWFSAATFLSKDDHRKVVVGTNEHQVRLYDISAQRRPVLSANFRETQIKVVREDLDGYTIYVGNGSGDLASLDIRTGRLLGCFLGKCSGSIRSIARHPKLPVIASCGLDCYLRFWDTKTRQLLSAIFLKQHLANVFIDSFFSTEALVTAEEPRVKENGDSEAVDFLPRGSAAGSGRLSNAKRKNSKTAEEHDGGDGPTEDQASEGEEEEGDDGDGNGEISGFRGTTTRRKKSSERGGSKATMHKKRSKRVR